MPTLASTHLTNRYRVQPNHANNYDTAHGGIVMKWLDEIGAMSAMRFAGHPCVTARMDGLNFRRPIPVGDTALTEAYVYDSGRTSVRVRVRAERENPTTGETEVTTEGHFVFVALDDGEPTGVPELTVETDAERELRDAALADAETDGNGS
ncbi:acyl-CoA thioesterase [Halomicrobium sp. LC1Hm]|uniref:acyl-CoA thioesterase n=1 Tax=Halomicrobium sp. LC1Hm TaxID=2610902 RepID=UPI0012982814|nr:acyl-CoA thioesterase [Halomicrobium sp. LC1Hm]QGA81174.1 Acyl-CoA hydrolase [Halomicrobium sp. LC1Hm]